MIWDCEFCNNFSACGLNYRVLESKRKHLMKCPACVPPRFTGFDGIPDWAEKDAEIHDLRLQNNCLKEAVILRGGR